MRRFFTAVRPGERRDTAVAFVTLFGFIGSHSVLETARDALFLSKVPASRLPWVYIAIAAVSLLTARAAAGAARGLAGRAALAFWTAVAALITFAFWGAQRFLGQFGFYALYVWSGVLTSLVLVHFWNLLGDLFSVTQAKRVYGIIGAGSTLGAIAGSGAASALARSIPAQQLVLVSAAGFFVTAFAPLLFKATPDGGSPALGVEETSSIVEEARYVARQPYARRVAVLLLVSTMALTVADYLFKATIAAKVPKNELGATFAAIYFVLNLLSFVVQVGVVGWLLRRFDLSTALAVLPVMLLLGGVGFVAGGGLVAALLIKGSDGALRYSLHRTSTELLFVPVGEEARRRMKGFLDVVAQRGGQALASLGILGAALLADAPLWLAAGLVVLAAGWGASAIEIRGSYLDIFRKHLRRESHGEGFRELDVASLETLVAALDSQNDDEVIAAMGVLEREGKSRLVPALILYHPTEEVVERALGLFVREKRKNIVHALDRLMDHESPRIRSAAVAARSVIAPDARLLNLRMSLEESPEVRATIALNLIASGELIGAEADERLATLLDRGSTATKVALADAIALRDARRFAPVLIRLSEMREPEVRLAAARAMARVRSPDFIPSLIRLVTDERTRREARLALLDHGPEGLLALEAALADASLSQQVRWELPRAVGLFPPEEASRVLLHNLPKEKDGMVRYRSIRALERIVATTPTLVLARAPIHAAIEQTVSRAYRYLDRRLTLESGAVQEPKRLTPGHELLIKMLEDKQKNAVGRVFKLLGLAFPTEDFAIIYRGLLSNRKEARASSVELVENVLDPPLRHAVVGLIDDLPDDERLGVAGQYHRPARASYEDLLQRMLESQSEALQDLTIYHIGELRLERFRAGVERIAEGGASRPDVARTLAILRLGEGRAEEAAC